jgi:hypothetical protein
VPRDGNGVSPVATRSVRGQRACRWFLAADGPSADVDVTGA